ncbi:MAG: 3-isopropylmalate dehydratase small subunit [Actinobacteria bacterium]|nr:3-isopropylmalate dehydratase small subunit [Actinomycetota bacterium]
MSTIRGRAWTFGRDVDTDLIIAARYLTMKTAEELACHLMEDCDPDFAQSVKPGDIIVAKENFGCGSSREHAPLAIMGAGVPVVIAKSFARIFYRNAFNTGLPILVAPDAAEAIHQDDELEVDLRTGTIRDLTSGVDYQAEALPDFMQELVAAGGLLPYLKQRHGGRAGRTETGDTAAATTAEPGDAGRD